MGGSSSSSLGDSPSGSPNEPSTSPDASLLGGEQIGGTGGGEVAVSDSPSGYIDNAIIGNVLRYGVGAGYDLITPARPEGCWGGRPMRLSAVLEVVGWEVLSGQYSTGTTDYNDASGISIVNLKIGPRLSWGQNSLYAGWGHRLTEQALYRDIARFEFIHSF